MKWASPAAPRTAWCSWPTVWSSRTPNPRSSSTIRPLIAPKTSSAKSCITDCERNPFTMAFRPAFSSRAVAALALAVTLPFAATACGGGGNSGGGGGGDTIVIGTKFDQPGLGMKNPDGKMSGFDVDVATYVAGELGYAPDKIEWKESPSSQRENLIQNGQVSFIAATYSITDARKEKVSFAGPYLITGQSLLVRADNNDITGKASLDNKIL